MKPVKYFEFFQEAYKHDYQSAAQVADSIFRYQTLIIYRMQTSKVNNDNYWYMVNALDLTWLDCNFDKESNPEYILKVINQFRAAIMIEYNSPELRRSCIIVRDTLKVIDVWTIALKKLIYAAAMDNVDKAWKLAV